VNLCLFGASGPVGRAVVRLALERGHAVTAVTRRPDAFGVDDPRLRVVGGDVADLAAVEAAVRGAHAVVSAVGVDPSRHAITTYSVGTRTMLEAMRRTGVRRIVSVSSKNLAEQGLAGEPVLFRWVVGPLLHAVNRTLYADMRRMEALLRDSDRDWTVLRPAGLFAADRITAYRTTPGHEPGVFTSTADLADALLAEASGPAPHVGAVVEVLTHEGTPSLPAMITGQAALHRRD
jgi:putative NADH-flavin reductase